MYIEGNVCYPICSSIHSSTNSQGVLHRFTLIECVSATHQEAFSQELANQSSTVTLFDQHGTLKSTTPSTDECVNSSTQQPLILLVCIQLNSVSLICTYIAMVYTRVMSLLMTGDCIFQDKIYEPNTLKEHRGDSTLAHNTSAFMGRNDQPQSFTEAEVCKQIF